MPSLVTESTTRPVRKLEDAAEHSATRQHIGAVHATAGEHYEIPKVRNDESIAATKAEHIKNLLESNSVKDWPRQTAVDTGAKIPTGRYCGRSAKKEVEVVRPGVCHREGPHGVRGGQRS